MKPPIELTDRQQWCCWRDSDGSKIPVMPSGGVFRSNDPSTFATYQEVKEASPSIAYVIQGDDPFTGIDLDNCLDEKGMLRPWAVPIAMRLDGISFAEISPSGRGIKFITRGKKTPGARCVKKFGQEKQQMEVYDFNRFWTITGKVYAGNDSIGDGQDAIDLICKEHLLDGNLQSFDLVDIQTAPPLPIDERAKRYAANAEAPSEGDRNNATFRLAGHLLSMEDEFHNRLSISEVERLVLDWNARMSEPLPELEIRKAVKSASVNGSQRAAKPPTVTTAIDRTPVLPRPKMPKDMMRPPGIISDIIDYTMRTSLYPQPELALAGAIALMATITGRKLADNYGTRTNMYVLGLAPSGSGKEQARKTNKTLLTFAGGESMIGPERIGSSAGMVVSISQQPAILFQLDEIGRLLSTLKKPEKSPHLYNIATVLMQVYGCSDSTWIGDAYADSRKVQRIDQPHPVIYGTSVPGGFWESLTADNVTDGLLGRMLPFQSAAGYVDPQKPEMIDPPESLVEAVRFWIELKIGGNIQTLHPKQVVANYTDAAEKRFLGHMNEISERRKHEDEQAAALWSRSAGKAGKLALIFAASRCPMSEVFNVEREDMDRGIKLSNWITRTIQQKVFEHVSENDQEDRTKRILRMLEMPLTKSQLTRKTQWLKRRERDEIVDTLIEAGLVGFDRHEDTGGAVKTTYQRVRCEN